MKRPPFNKHQSTRAPEHPRNHCALAFWCTGALVLSLASPAFAEAGYSEVKAGNVEYGKGDYLKAIDNYEKAALKNSKEARIDHNLGAAYYKQGDHAKAIDHFQKALLSDDKEFVKNVHYDLGNSFYKAGIAVEDSDIKAAIARLEEALPHYEKTMAADLKDEDAKYNYEFVKKEIERLKLKQQQQQQSKQDQKSSQSQEKDKDQQQDPQQEQSSQEQSKQEQDQEEQQGQQDQQDQQEKQDQGSEQQQDQSQQGEQKDEQKEPDQGQDKTGDGQSQRQEQEQGDASGQDGEGQILSQKEANALLSDFDRNEQPKGLLNFIRKSREERPVEKDW